MLSRVFVCALALNLVLLPATWALGQGPVAGAVSDAQATALLTQSVSALQGSVTVTDVTLSGSVQRVVGITDESGTAVLKAFGRDSSVMLSLPSGNRTEVHWGDSGSPVGTWTGPDGVTNKIPFHNLLTEPAWFFPLFAVSRGLAASGFVASYVGLEKIGEASLQHVRVAQTLPNISSAITANLLPLSNIDIYLDPATSLPSFIRFNVHPDDNQLVDIPMTVYYSDYRSTNGVLVPFHVQEFFGSDELFLDLQFQNVVLNSGLTSSQFSPQ